MPEVQSSDVKLEIGHVLFIDIVGYSKLSINEQSAQVETLKKIVLGTEQFRQAEAEGKLLRLPTGDGGALVFRNHSEAPVLCAMEISRALRSHPTIGVRMGIHSGPVNEITDLNQQANVAGAGINYAQRVMDCGDAGHILLSRHMAEDLETFDRWKPFLHDLGECEVKHGVRVGVTNLYSDEFGNSNLPSKLEAVRKHRSRVRWAEVAIALLVVGAIVAAFFYISRRPAPSLTDIPGKSIAVLPFVNMSDDKANDYFSDGISEELLNLLAKIPQLKVTLLEPPPKVRTTDPKAYALYLEAVQLGRQNTAEAFEKSDALYRQVLEIDPRYAPAWSELARNFINKVRLGMLSSQEGYARAREMAEKALAIDPDYAPAHDKLGAIANDQNDDAAAAKHFERALTLDPTNLDVVSNAASFLLSLGRLYEALALYEALVRRDPVNTTTLSNLGNKQRWSGRFDEAIASFRTALSLNPGRGSVHSQLGVALLLKGDVADALAEIEQEPLEAYRMIGLPMAYRALGRKADSDAALAALTAKYEKDASYDIAPVYAFCGEADQAFVWLDKALAYHDAGLAEIVSENLFDKIHSDPRWLPYLRKIGKAPEQLAKINFKVTLPPQ